MAAAKDFEIVPNKKGKATIWKCFGFVKENDGPVDQTRVTYKLCETVLKYSGNTTNLTDHVCWKHSTYLRQLSAESSSDAVASVVVKQTTCTGTHSSQQSLSTIFSPKLPHNSSRAKAVSSAILQFIVKDLQPFSVVQNFRFQNLLHVLEPRYTVPSRQQSSC